MTAGRIRHHLLAALPGWLVARLLVLVALGIASVVAGQVDPVTAARRPALREGLLAWDARWYRLIATHGYEALDRESLRFFPLLPLLARALAPVTGGPGPALLVLANGTALAAGALLHRLALEETGDERLARRAAWLVALVPPLHVMVMGYTEPIAISLSVAAFLALRRRRWWWAAGAGVLSGLTRPVGVLLAVPAAVEAARGLRGSPRRELVARGAAVAAPLAGVAAFLAWVGARFGDPLLPLEVQQRSHLRGGFAVPLVTMFRTLAGDLPGHSRTNPYHLPWLLVLVALVVVAWRRWPPSYAAFATVAVVVASAARNWGSLERYGFGAFPLVLALASVTARRWARAVVLVLCGLGVVVYASLAFVNLYVP